jgi:hypothetical protein
VTSCDQKVELAPALRPLHLERAGLRRAQDTRARFKREFVGFRQRLGCGGIITQQPIRGDGTKLSQMMSNDRRRIGARYQRLEQRIDSRVQFELCQAGRSLARRNHEERRVGDIILDHESQAGSFVNAFMEWRYIGWIARGTRICGSLTRSLWTRKWRVPRLSLTSIRRSRRRFWGSRAISSHINSPRS